MEFIMVPLIVGLTVGGFYGVVELLAHRRERLNIIEKMGPNLNPDMLRSRFDFIFSHSRSGQGFGALKAAGLLMGIGLGLIFAFFVNYCAFGISENRYLLDEMGGILYGASVLLFGGLGLLITFMIETRMRKK
jgi:hypothetical protein